MPLPLQCHYICASNIAKHHHFKNSFNNRLSRKFVVNDNKISHHPSNALLHYPVTLTSENQQQPEQCTVINDKSQGSVATQFKNGGNIYTVPTVCYRSTVESALKEFLKSDDIW